MKDLYVLSTNTIKMLKLMILFAISFYSRELHMVLPSSNGTVPVHSVKNIISNEWATNRLNWD